MVYFIDACSFTDEKTSVAESKFTKLCSHNNLLCNNGYYFSKTGKEVEIENNFKTIKMQIT